MHFVSIGEKISREISPIEMSHTAHIPVTNARFQFHDIAVNQVKVLIQKLVMRNPQVFIIYQTKHKKIL